MRGAVPQRRVHNECRQVPPAGFLVIRPRGGRSTAVPGPGNRLRDGAADALNGDLKPCVPGVEWRQCANAANLNRWQPILRQRCSRAQRAPPRCRGGFGSTTCGARRGDSTWCGGERTMCARSLLCDAGSVAGAPAAAQSLSDALISRAMCARFTSDATASAPPSPSTSETSSTGTAVSIS